MEHPRATQTTLALSAIYLACAGAIASAQTFTHLNRHPSSSTSQTEGASCGGTSLTQNTDTDTILTPHTISCSAAGVNADNFYARNFPIASAISVKCVDFGIESNDLEGTVRVRLYTHPAPGAPVTANLTLLPGSEVTLTIPANTTLQKFSAVYADPGISVPANSNLVVEIFTPCRLASCSGDGGGTFLGSNPAGQIAPTYIKAPACNVNDFVSMVTIGAGHVHVIMELGVDSETNPCTEPLANCAADIAGPEGPDGVVNVIDLLSVIQTWGQNGLPNGPRPAGDCSPLPNGNCIVNVGDLLQVISSWGACPCEVRACCLPNGACQNLCLTACDQAGGTWQAAGSDCSTTECRFLFNDECAGAIVVTNGQTPIDNTNATTSSGIPGGACVAGGSTNFRKDLWYSYTATCTGMVTVDLCGTTGTVTDTVLSVFAGPCASLNEVACDDDSCSGNPAGDRSRAQFLATAGVEYRIRVGVWGSNPGGPMMLTIACGPTPPHGIVQLRQLHWGGAVDQPIAILFSRVGEARWTFDVSNPIHRQLLLANGGGFINLSLALPNPAQGDQGMHWAVRNLYLAYPTENHLIAARPSVQFDLPLDQGTAAINGLVMMSITPQPLLNPQPQFQFSGIFTHPIYHAGGRDDGGSDLSQIPIIIGPWTGPILLPIEWASISISVDDVAEIDENTNHCAPASCARSLSYLGVVANPQSICDDLAGLMETSKESGTTDENMEAGKETYTKGHNLDIDTRIEYGADRFEQAMDALAAGCDVEGLITWTGGGGHAAMITSIVKWPDGSYTITYVDDPQQGDDTPENQEHTIHVEPDGDFDGGNMDGVMIECYN